VFCEKRINEKIEQIKKTAGKLVNLDDSKVGIWLLRNGLSIESMVYFLRTVSPSKISESLSNFDQIILKYFEKITRIILNEAACKQFNYLLVLGDLASEAHLLTAVHYSTLQLVSSKNGNCF